MQPPCDFLECGLKVNFIASAREGKEGFLTLQTPFGMTEFAAGTRPNVQESGGLGAAEIDLDVEFSFKEVGAALGVAQVFGGIAAGVDLQSDAAALE